MITVFGKICFQKIYVKRISAVFNISIVLVAVSVWYWNLLKIVFQSGRYFNNVYNVQHEITIKITTVIDVIQMSILITNDVPFSKSIRSVK